MKLLHKIDASSIVSESKRYMPLNNALFCVCAKVFVWADNFLDSQ